MSQQGIDISTTKAPQKLFNILGDWRLYSVSFLKEWIEGIHFLREKHNFSSEELEQHLEDVSDRILKRINESQSK